MSAYKDEHWTSEAAEASGEYWVAMSPNPKYDWHGGIMRWSYAVGDRMPSGCLRSIHPIPDPVPPPLPTSWKP